MKFNDFINQIDSFSKGEVQEIKDIFQDIIDEYSLRELKNGESYYTQDLYYSIVNASSSVYIYFQVEIEDYKSIDEFLERIRQLGYKVSFYEDSIKSIFGFLKSIEISRKVKNIKGGFIPPRKKSANESINHKDPKLYFQDSDIDMIQDVLLDLIDKYNLERVKRGYSNANYYTMDYHYTRLDTDLRFINCIEMFVCIVGDGSEKSKDAKKFVDRLKSIGYVVDIIPQSNKSSVTRSLNIPIFAYQLFIYKGTT